VARRCRVIAVEVAQAAIYRNLDRQIRIVSRDPLTKKFMSVRYRKEAVATLPGSSMKSLSKKEWLDRILRPNRRGEGQGEFGQIDLVIRRGP
jgi:hypothetical protein